MTNLRHSPSQQHVEAHLPAAIRRRLNERARPSYLRDFIYGAIDGAVTTFAVVSGVAGAGLSSSVVIILGIANLIGDGFSMAASNYLGIRAERELQLRIRRSERQHIEWHPEGERAEIREIFRQKGFAGDDLDRAVEIITSDVNQWIDTMVTDEHGLALDGPDPRLAAAMTFVAFIIVGFIPLMAFVWQWLLPDTLENPYLWSTLLTSAAFFGVGAGKSWFIERPWYREGLITLAVGGTAAALAYLAGDLIGGLLPK
ncbi:VIT1/CCC1 transporter family protein [Bythopirellula polymerisocia]|uniref:VIT family protein n=1 Tax=Bythopirellula polymerisocia TaxID=2528003 RepID=A0A5C6D502_9BACT|nr:VIT1/CCC1 transporter family protein [Bythopirellula polymerisocia]TWU30286.1 VIT family protein [Bythopirellula polymerisocia]